MESYDIPEWAVLQKLLIQKNLKQEFWFVLQGSSDCLKTLYIVTRDTKIFRLNAIRTFWGPGETKTMIKLICKGVLKLQKFWKF